MKLLIQITMDFVKIFSLVLLTTACTAQSSPPLNVAIFVHEGVQLLDFSGPSEVFSDVIANGRHAYNVYTVAPSQDEILSQGFLKVKPQYSIANCPKPDIVLLPGGDTGRPLADKAVIEWIKKSSLTAKYMVSVCTGALLLAEAGLLNGKQATTHTCCWGELEKYKDIKVVRNVRFIDNGNVITTEGISAGIDGALYLVEKINGLEAANATARYMMYDWKRDEIEKIVVKNP
jgi:transcriptional regulator GlxA family with amidase domain